ncbi:hypothetical protein DH2020_006096 [Rehmannia glutinosa]|uniref:chorismate mutase n=1 Tax=Rehmannia glutinosa TaxID=99300 RepID=A0ABR0XHZ1_REHGL
MADFETAEGSYVDSLLNLESLRKSLVRQEDTIVFSLIERSKYPINSPLYDDKAPGNLSASLLDFFIKESEALQAKALSRRIHFGKFVAEVKFRDAPDDYIPAIRAKDREALMKLLTFQSVEEMIKKRVEKKAMIFGQDVDLNQNDINGKYKVNPSIVSQLYGEWVIPLTKYVQVEYLLRRLD